MFFLDRQTVDEIHEQQLDAFGGLPGVKDDNLIESAIAAPRNSYEYLDASIAYCGAVYLYHIAKNHGYTDANKRTSVHAALTFLDANGYTLKLSKSDLADIAEGAANNSISKDGVIKIFEENLTPII